MRKSLLLSFILIFTAISAHAYAPKRKRKSAKKSSSTETFKFGVHIGAGGAKLFQEQLTETPIVELDDLSFFQRSKLHFQGGVFGEYKLMPQLGMRLSALYSLHGKRTKYEDPTDPDKPASVNINLQYILGELTARYYPLSDIQLAILIGGYGGYALSAEGKANVDVGGSGMNFKGSFKEHCNNWDFGVIAGVDYEFDFGLAVGLKSNIGLRKVQTEDQANDSGRKIAVGNNLSASLTVGYNFAKLL